MMKQTLITVILCSTVLFSCANERKEPVRHTVSDLSAQDANAQAAIFNSPLISAMDDVKTPAACARLNELSSQVKADANMGVYSYFSSLTLPRSQIWMGRIDIEQSPFTQMFLGEKFSIGSEEEFYNKAKAEYEAGNLGYMSWLVVSLTYHTGIYSQTVQLSGINSKLEENFPGIYGESSAATGALFWNIAKKIVNLPKMNVFEVSDSLSRKLPMFPAEGSWDSLADSTRVSIASAGKTFRDKSSDREKLCALVLMHHNFSQLLRLKGHRAPVSAKNGKNGYKLAEAVGNPPEFRKKEVPGAFMSLKDRKSIVLESEHISAYDPRKGLLGVTAALPNGAVSDKAGNVNDALAFMEALVYSFEGTSPVGATALKNGNDYLLGDVLKSPFAILPAEAHSLALGMLTMNFKNLAALHIRKIDITGAEASDEDLASGKKIAAGIVLTKEPAAKGIAVVRLDDVIRLARVTSYLENSLAYFLKEKPEDIVKLNPVYEKKTLISLFGKKMFPSEDLPPSLMDNLQTLRFPIVLLLSQLGTSANGCSSEMEWNLGTGEKRVLAACSDAQKNELADIFELMGRASNAPILMKKAQALRAR